MDLLKQISQRLAAVESKVGGGSGGGGGGEDEGPKPSVIAADQFLATQVAAFTAACKAIDATDMAATATSAFSAMRTFIDMASQCYKPTDNKELMTLAGGMIAMIRKAADDKNKARRTPLEYHSSSFADALGGSLSWMLSSQGQPGFQPPAKAIKEAAIDGAMFYVNKVRKEFKGKDNQAVNDAWVKALLGMLNALMAYAKEHHTAGLVWCFKAQGAKACSEYTGSARAAPAAPAAKKAAAPEQKETQEQEDAVEVARKKAQMAKGNLFAQLAAIDQSGGKTAGLRQTKKNKDGKRIVENDKSGVMTAAKKAKIAKMRGGGKKKKRWRSSNPPFASCVVKNGPLKTKSGHVFLMRTNATKNR